MWILLLIAVLVLVVPVGVLVAWSILADAEMLVDAGRWWALGAFLVVPVAVALHAIFADRPPR